MWSFEDQLTDKERVKGPLNTRGKSGMDLRFGGEGDSLPGLDIADALFLSFLAPMRPMMTGTSPLSMLMVSARMRRSLRSARRRESHSPKNAMPTVMINVPARTIDTSAGREIWFARCLKSASTGGVEGVYRRTMPILRCSLVVKCTRQVAYAHYLPSPALGDAIPHWPSARSVQGQRKTHPMSIDKQIDEEERQLSQKWYLGGWCAPKVLAGHLSLVEVDGPVVGGLETGMQLCRATPFQPLPIAVRQKSCRFHKMEEAPRVHHEEICTFREVGKCAEGKPPSIPSLWQPVEFGVLFTDNPVHRHCCSLTAQKTDWNAGLAGLPVGRYI